VIFDLWDTLVPFPIADWHTMTATVAHALGVSPDELDPIWTAEGPARMIGDMASSLRRVVAALGLAVDESFIADEIARRIEFHATCLGRPRPGAAETLAQLRRSGLRIGLISNGTSDVPIAWKTALLAPMVDVAVFSSSERLVKPDLRIYKLALERLGVVGTDCAYVGDGAGGELDGALAAGMYPMQLRTDGLSDRGWAGETIRTLCELPDRLRTRGLTDAG
jgi:putative hydrolase of the HAD superfamily